ncbi:hypothetical protein MPTK1_5g03250 [Marchantia polymorpha subsp. ruderalis]|nr:hypothetical protein MARPO_0485s0001 [Marchantia polymorpha]BBN10396.1 hypothetical protein Mp_5g03250 [Marchantia polymorpha subsp. ruderalis]PTQ26740.1 hypothetical protein MARPO_0485s0001 [Marchantia polymorpha]PTQ26741.1 hypothetical protein MARPO_0485s0001 [Marchantia polymorpha]PTQ26742.1 hypothetical protein MARPO_0485s0001 [Marchantia polymorpha]|eukprot:PTQ26739.1 hypothetical protein MARPO_0485s0001 [Marchantia polymorpha]
MGRHFRVLGGGEGWKKKQRVDVQMVVKEEKNLVLDWKAVPRIVMDNIISRLPVMELLHGRLVCKRWKAVIDGSPDEVGFSLDDIPDGLIENILARFTVLELLQLRLVCKRWKGLIDAPIFWEQCERESISEPCFLVIWSRGGKQSLHAHFPLSDKWRRLPPSVVYPQKRIDAAGSSTRGRRGHAACTTIDPASDSLQGLWCIQTMRTLHEGTRRDGTTITLHNPISGWLTRLPGYCDPRLKASPPCNAVIVMMQRDGRSFKALSAGIHSEGCRGTDFKDCVATRLYDSESQTWTEAANLPFSHLRFRYDYARQVAHVDCGTHVYFVVHKRNEMILLNFVLQSKTWHTVPGLMPAQDHADQYDFITISKSNTSLVLAFRTQDQRCFSKPYGLFPSIFCWNQMQSSEDQVWQEVQWSNPPATRIPVNFRHLFYVFKWFAKGDFIFFRCAELWGAGALVLDLRNVSWKVTSFDPVTNPNPRCASTDTVALELRLSSLVGHRRDLPSTSRSCFI